jgi:hypothetical protein
METIHRFNLWGLIDFWAAAVKTGSWLLLSFASFSLLFSALSSMLVAAVQKREY